MRYFSIKNITKIKIEITLTSDPTTQKLFFYQLKSIIL